MSCQGLGDCDDARMQRIYEYLDGALTREDIAEIKQHLQECPECTEEYDLECVIRTVVKRSCTEFAPENLKNSILDRIHSMNSAEV
ncbi:mycothiol system anti-sigma-R factor [Arthrobacter cupressi]|uniref:Mycothiol system anti-sigma-R factor n=1 Tax=Arthrobacter cupressi TaxID=1045773 RepID=A0A1G8TXW6_9MICC|nr:mycothiol system anti-sigma-R factor [Arthrobacter cupressi]NYD76642.1 anti-sigma factor (TIGR02949 family) [Arthrobacter cupressi]SDJ46339.1 mycothiol system anti-sigma-R factor [Arthrobacter cupressi]